MYEKRVDADYHKSPGSGIDLLAGAQFGAVVHLTVTGRRRETAWIRLSIPTALAVATALELSGPMGEVALTGWRAAEGEAVRVLRLLSRETSNAVVFLEQDGVEAQQTFVPRADLASALRVAVRHASQARVMPGEQGAMPLVGSWGWAIGGPVDPAELVEVEEVGLPGRLPVNPTRLLEPARENSTRSATFVPTATRVWCELEVGQFGSAVVVWFEVGGDLFGVRLGIEVVDLWGARLGVEGQARATLYGVSTARAALPVRIDYLEPHETVGVVTVVSLEAGGDIVDCRVARRELQRVLNEAGDRLRALSGVR